MNTSEGLCVICTGLIFLSQYSWCYATLAAMSLMDRISGCSTAGLTAGYMVSCNFDLGCHGTWPVLPGPAPGQHHLELQSSDLKTKTFEQFKVCVQNGTSFLSHVQQEMNENFYFNHKYKCDNEIVPMNMKF